MPPEHRLEIGPDKTNLLEQRPYFVVPLEVSEPVQHGWLYRLIHEGLWREPKPHASEDPAEEPSRRAPVEPLVAHIRDQVAKSATEDVTSLLRADDLLDPQGLAARLALGEDPLTIHLRSRLPCDVVQV